MNPFGHVDVRVKDMAKALPFYTAVMPALGFKRTFHASAWKAFAGDGDLPSAAYFALTEEPAHAPNKNRIAFWAASRAEVDKVADAVRAAGGNITGGPQPYADVSPTYYAVYFEDPSGNRLECVHRTN